MKLNQKLLTATQNKDLEEIKKLVGEGANPKKKF
jgi:hypothetical protein